MTESMQVAADLFTENTYINYLRKQPSLSKHLCSYVPPTDSAQLHLLSFRFASVIIFERPGLF